MECAVNLFFILIGYKYGGEHPLFTKEILSHHHIMVDPIPQALILTAIVIGLAVTCLLIAIAIRIYEKYGTYDVRELKKLRG